MNWIPIKDKSQWSRYPSKIYAYILSYKNEHNVCFPHILGKIPGLLRLCWVILMSTSHNVHIMLNKYYAVMTYKYKAITY